VIDVKQYGPHTLVTVHSDDMQWFSINMSSAKEAISVFWWTRRGLKEKKLRGKY
jgi:hypothetical protein